MDLSIIVPSYNQPKTISQCLDSLLNQKTSVTFEIIVVDSSNKENQAEVSKICARSNKVRLITLIKQTYPGTARNIGIKDAKSENISLIDSDCLAMPGWIENIVKHIDHDLVLSGSIVNGTPNSVYGTCSYLIEFNHFLPFKEEVKHSEMAGSGNFSTKKSTFEKVGYFSDDRAFEDMIYCRRFIEKGGRIELHSKIQIMHMNRTDLESVAKNQEILGKASAMVRKANNLKPKIIFKYNWLAYAMTPFRFLSILSRMRLDKNFLLFILYSPVIIYILHRWSIGFKEGAKS